MRTGNSIVFDESVCSSANVRNYYQVADHSASERTLRKLSVFLFATNRVSNKVKKNNRMK